MVYNLEQLHWQEFERLVGFYLKEIVGEGVSRFDGSQDQGRDAVFNGTASAFPSKTSPWSGYWIFQAKHRTLRNATLQNVEKKLLLTLDQELYKVFIKHSFNCDNYIYLTNINISNSFKAEAEKIFHTFCRQHDLLNKNFHVLDYKDIEIFLDQNLNVRNSFPSMLKFVDLEAIYLKKEDIKNKGFLKAAQNTIGLFVSTAHYQRAIELIDTNDILMLVGNPKSGKTSIVEAIALCYADEGNFKPYFIRNTDEFFTITAYLPESERVLFICDDMFGIHELDEAKLKDWTDYFQSVIGSLTGEHKFLFTTRKYIFEAFARKSGLRELFPGENDPNRYVLKLIELTTEEREQILEKHLIHSELPEAKVEAIQNLKPTILSAEDFSPEVIRSLIQIVKRTTTNIDRAIVRHIKNPNQYLKDFFENISEQKRLLLLSVAVSPTVEMSEVEQTFDVLLNETNTKPEITFETFINEIENSIVKRRDYVDSIDLEFYHPTMYDVIVGIFKQDRRYRTLMLSNANVELISLLTILKVDETKSNKLHSAVNELDYLVKGIQRLLERIHNLSDVIRLVRYYENLNIETAKELTYFKPMKTVQKSLRVGISDIIFLEHHQHSRIDQWIQLFDKWTLINGKECPTYFKELEKLYRATESYDYWRLMFLIESISDGFIRTTLPHNFINEFSKTLSNLANELRYGLHMNNNRPYTEETWLPRFREADDLIVKMKKSQFGKRVILNIQDDWEQIKRWAEFAKNRHGGMVSQGHWKRRFKKLRNYETFSSGL